MRTTPPNYLLLFKNWEFFRGNLKRCYFKPPLAIATIPPKATAPASSVTSCCGAFSSHS